MTDSWSGDVLRCPICATSLAPRERVRVETIPATVPAHLPASEQAKYRRVDRYETVECRNGHKLRRRGSTLSTT